MALFLSKVSVCGFGAQVGHTWAHKNLARLPVKLTHTGEFDILGMST